MRNRLWWKLQPNIGGNPCLLKETRTKKLSTSQQLIIEWSQILKVQQAWKMKKGIERRNEKRKMIQCCLYQSAFQSMFASQNSEFQFEAYLPGSLIWFIITTYKQVMLFVLQILICQRCIKWSCKTLVKIGISNISHVSQLAQTQGLTS